MRSREAILLTLALVAAACAQDRSAAPITEDHVLLQPQDSSFQATAPDSFRVRFETTAGDFTVQVMRDWSPHGADRFYNLVRNGYYDNVYFFRVVDGFMAQFGIHGDPRVNAAWNPQRIQDDLVVGSNRRGTVTFAMSSQPNSRTTQLFINFADNARLDDAGFAPIGDVVSGMETVDALYSGYGEGAPQGRGPRQDRIQAEGNAYLERDFPNLDHVRRATIED
ncbi:MAG: peptidylprolyl isomerase [Longimicrobiales bacterium]